MFENIELNNWMIGLLVAGFIPYRNRQVDLGNGRWRREFKAVFWSFTLTRRRNKSIAGWSLQITLIDRLREIIWAIIDQLKK